MHARGGNSWTRVRKADASSSFRRMLWPCRGGDPRSPFLAQLIDGCLLSLLFIAPLLMGGRHPVGYFAWMLIAAILGVATLLHYRPTKPSAGDFIWLAAAGLVILQLVPLPTSLLSWLNPGLSALLPGMTDPAALPFSEAIYSNRPISINPYKTRLALGMLLAYGVIFHSVTRRVQTTADVRRLLGWIAIATVAISILALAQRFAGNGKFLWIYQHISRSASDVVKGPFQNQNHLAQLMALGLGPLLYFATSRAGYWRTVLATSGATLCLLTGLLTFSRGGAIAITTAGLVMCAGLVFTGYVDRQRWQRIVLPTLLTLVLLGIWGGEKLLTRLETLGGGADLASVSLARLELWQSHLRAIAASPWVGYGAASHEDIYPAFIEQDFGVKYTHGESGYLPIQLENGLLGAILLTCALLLIVLWAWRSLRISSLTAGSVIATDEKPGEMRSLAVACLAGLAASAVQSLGDFIWYIPACLTPTLMLLACLGTLASQNEAANQHQRSSFRVPWLAVPSAVLVAALTWSMGPARASHLWTHYRMLVRSAADQHPANDALPDYASTETVPILNEIIRRDPMNPVPRLRLAKELLKLRDDQDQRLRVSDEKLLNAAIHQSIIGLRTAPLRSEGYLWLTHACHHSRSASDSMIALLKQALRVRPSDTSFHYQVGLAAFQIGQPQWGLRIWKPVIETPTKQRNKILGEMTAFLPADFLLQSFSLDLTALTILYKQSRSNPTDIEVSTRIGRRLIELLVQAADKAEDPEKAAEFLHRASHVLRESDGQASEVISLASSAVDASPGEWGYRIWLTDLLIRDERWEEATKHVRWCQARKPLDPTVARQKQVILQRFQR